MAKILVVDDSESARDLVATVVGYAGHESMEAADGSEALAAVRKEPPALIICDIVMPTMDGFEFVRQVREISPFAATPVIFHTATYLEEGARTLARTYGVSDIITKPAEPQDILDAVSRNLGAQPTVLMPSPPLEEFRRKHPGLRLAKLAQTAEAVVPRLDAMIELGLQLASERVPERLLNDFCGAVRKIIGARYATIGVLENGGGALMCRFASGMSQESVAVLTSPPLPMALPEGVLSKREGLRLHGLPGDPRAVGLPGEHPPVHTFLCTPISSPYRDYGWLCLTDKVGGDGFSDGDQGLAKVLAAQVGRIYENGSLYAEVNRSVARLEAEVAERKRAQEQVHKLNDELEERVRQRTAELESVNQELEAFSYSISHDLRAPVRAMHGLAEMLSRDFTENLPEGAQRHLQRVQDNATKMGQLIDGLLAFSRLSRQPLKKRRVLPSTIVHAVLDELQGEKSGGRLKISTSELPACQADPALLEQVFVSLLSNALKYTRDRDPAVIEIGCRDQEDQCVYFVKDNGAGFDLKHAGNLFGVFHRLHRADEFEGAGVGLAIAHRIIQRHGGRIWAEAAPDKGATFFFHPGRRHARRRRTLFPALAPPPAASLHQTCSSRLF